MAKNRRENMLDHVPAKNGKLGTRLSKNGTMQLVVKNDGAFKNFCRYFMHIPEITTIDLDAYGSFVWETIDGKKSIHEIGELMRDVFGTDVEPLYERLCWYMKIMKDNGFVDFRHRAA